MNDKSVPSAPAPGLVDTHCHLNLDPLSEEPELYWQRARARGVRKAVVIGTTATTSAAALALATGEPDLYCAVGIHPTETAKASEDDVIAIEKLASQNQRVVAVGESGLDYYWDDSPRTRQQELLEWHAELALRLELPLVLHIRDAYDEAARQLEPLARRGLRGVIHCFAGEAREVDPFVDWGWPISFSGILTYPKAANVRGAAKRTPIEQCLVETDCSWLTPRGAPSKTNEPAFVVLTAQALAVAKGASLEEICAVTTRTACRVFGLGTAD